MVAGRAMAGLALATSVLLSSGCRTDAPRRAGPAHGVAPVGTVVLVSPGPELVGLARHVRPALVRIVTQAEVFKSPGRWAQGLLSSFVGLIDVHPYWEWPLRVVSFPLYLIFGPFDLGGSSGSGVVVGDGGLVLTCAHVVDNAAQVRCELTDGRRAEGQVVAADEERDLALLRLVGLEGAVPEPVPLRRGAVEPGEPVVAMGFPTREVHEDAVFGTARIDELAERPNPTVSFGIVSAVAVELGNPDTRYVQIDAALNPGSSGGPVLGVDGTIVGVATMVGQDKQNECYAVPVSTVLEAFGERLEGRPRDGEGRRDD